jgi:uncharacterized membrane protein
MSDMVVLGFDGIHTADEVLNKLRSLQKENLIDLEDACVVERENDGKVHIKQAVNLTAIGAASGGTMDKVLPEIEPFKPLVPKISLSNEAEAKLKAELSKIV